MMKIFPHLFNFILSSSVIFTISAAENAPKIGDFIPPLRVNIGVEIKSLDPTTAEDFASVRILMNTGQGLTKYDENLKPQPNLAKSWNWSKDRRTITFQLKESYWSDGHPVLASQFESAIIHALKPEVISKLSMPLVSLIEGGSCFKQGKCERQKIQVSAPSQNKLVISLTRPSTLFLHYMALPFAYPMREPGSIKLGAPVTGSFALESVSAKSVMLRPSGLNPKAQQGVEFVVVPQPGTAVALFEKKELDVLERVPSSHFGKFKNSQELFTRPFLATYYLGFNISKPPFDQLALRKSIGLSIDRTEIEKIFQDPIIPTDAWVPYALKRSKKAKAPLPQLKEAQNLKSRFKVEEDFLEIVTDSQEKNTLILTVIQKQIQNALGLKLRITSKEWKAYLSQLSKDAPGFFRFAWLAPVPDPISHLQVFTSDNPNNYTGFSDLEYDRLVQKIEEALPSKNRDALIDQAEQILKAHAIIIPIYQYIQSFLIRSEWQGLKITPMGIIDFSTANRGPSL
ncbi:MAG: peptide ABC transporter substrate-binding protein [Oligoflexia bacterium]|nr:peptide ABC transporter substrate-binding protein [Oligoflexia bacterium]